MTQVRFQVLFGPASLRPWRADWPSPTLWENAPRDGADLEVWVEQARRARSTADVAADTKIAAAEARGALLADPVPSGGEWYGWRLMGANNRELGRSAASFVSYQWTRRAIGQLQRGAARLVQHSTTDPATGRWGWRVDLDGVAVAVSGRWYERDHDGRLGAAKFISLTVEAVLVDGVVTLHDRRGPRVVHQRAGDTT